MNAMQAKGRAAVLAALMLCAVCALGLCAMLPQTAWGDEPEKQIVAKTDTNKEFSSLQEAFYGKNNDGGEDAVQNGETLTLLKDIELTGVAEIAWNRSFTLDLAGKTITGDASNPALQISAGCDVVLTDSVGGGKIVSTQTGYECTVNVQGTLRVAGGTIDSGTNRCAIRMLGEGANLEVTGGKIVARPSEGSGFAIVGIQMNNVSGFSVDISGGEVSASSTALYLPSDCTATVSGNAVVRGDQRALVALAGDVSIAGGTLVSSAPANAAGSVAASTGTIVIGKPSGVGAGDTDNYGGNVKLAITGGSIVNENASGNALVLGHDTGDTSGSLVSASVSGAPEVQGSVATVAAAPLSTADGLSVSGGTFNSPTVAPFVANGQAVLASDGAYVVADRSAVADKSVASVKGADGSTIYYTKKADADAAATELGVKPSYVTYEVTYLDHDGTKLATESVVKGEAPAKAPTPSRDGYSFLGWDGDVTAPVVANTTFKARYEVKPQSEQTQPETKPETKPQPLPQPDQKKDDADSKKDLIPRTGDDLAVAPIALCLLAGLAVPVAFAARRRAER